MVNNVYRLGTEIKLLVFAAVILTFFVRPFALGLDNSLYTNMLLLLVGLIVALSTPGTLYNGKKIFILIFSIYLSYSLYKFITSGNVVSFLTLLQVISVYILFRNYQVMQLFFKYLKNVFLLLIVLGIINFGLECLKNGPDSLLMIRDIPYGKGVYEFSLFFPLTWSKALWYIPGSSIISGVHQRQYFFFIEPGMAPTFFIASLYLLWNDEKEKYKILQTIIFIIGILITFSTSGPLILIFSLSIWYFFKRNEKKFSPVSLAFFVVGIYFSWYAFNYMPVFGRQAKVELSASMAASVETHEAILHSAIMVGVALLGLYGYFAMKYKQNKVLTIVITSIIALGYISNYVGYTTLATMFLFWDKTQKRTLEDKNGKFNSKMNRYHNNVNICSLRH